MNNSIYREKKAEELEDYLRRKYEERELRPVGIGKTTKDWERIPSSDWSKFQ